MVPQFVLMLQVRSAHRNQNPVYALRRETNRAVRVQDIMCCIKNLQYLWLSRTNDGKGFRKEILSASRDSFQSRVWLTIYDLTMLSCVACYTVNFEICVFIIHVEIELVVFRMLFPIIWLLWLVSTLLISAHI